MREASQCPLPQILTLLPWLCSLLRFLDRSDDQPLIRRTGRFAVVATEGFEWGLELVCKGWLWNK